MISVVGDNLGPAVGQSDSVFTLNNSVLVLGLLLVEVGPRVVVRNSVGVGEGPRGNLDFAIEWGWGSIGRGWRNAGRSSHGNADKSNGENDLEQKGKTC